jgi:hypothetical protein
MRPPPVSTEESGGLVGTNVLGGPSPPSSDFAVGANGAPIQHVFSWMFPAEGVTWTVEHALRPLRPAGEALSRDWWNRAA